MGGKIEGGNEMQPAGDDPFEPQLVPGYTPCHFQQGRRGAAGYRDRNALSGEPAGRCLRIGNRTEMRLHAIGTDQPIAAIGHRTGRQRHRGKSAPFPVKMKCVPPPVEDRAAKRCPSGLPP